MLRNSLGNFSLVFCFNEYKNDFFLLWHNWYRERSLCIYRAGTLHGFLIYSLSSSYTHWLLLLLLFACAEHIPMEHKVHQIFRLSQAFVMFVFVYDLNAPRSWSFSFVSLPPFRDPRRLSHCCVNWNVMESYRKKTSTFIYIWKRFIFFKTLSLAHSSLISTSKRYVDAIYGDARKLFDMELLLLFWNGSWDVRNCIVAFRSLDMHLH